LLTGVKKQEYTNATSTGMVNATTHEWDGGIISRLGFDKGLFGSLSQPGEQVGFVKDDVAKEIGYKPLVVLPATHDTASAVLAAPLSGQTPYISSGTWSLLGVEQNAVHSDDNSRMVNYSNEGSINFTFRYQKNIMGLWMIQSIKRELNDKYDFAQLSQMARGVQTDYLVNVNDNRFLSPESMIDEVQAAVGQKLDTATLMRVVYNSLAKSYLEAIEELERNTNTQFKTLNIIGGGCRDMLLNELTAQLTKKTIITGPVEATAIGNLIMQMIGVGQLKGIQAARDIIKKSFDINEVRV
jgi:rhamnulokinase